MSRPDVMVIIATRNRAESLRETLECLARQETGGRFRYEVIVADNNSTDNTRPLVHQLSLTYPVRLHYVFERRPGKAHALNRALRAADSTFVAFTDDDTLIPPDWLSVLLQTFEQFQADGVGGPVVPEWLSPRPAWLTDAILRQLGMVQHGREARAMGSPTTPFIGPNAAYRRELYDYLGVYENHANEDAEWFHRTLDAGCKLVYQPAARVRHKIDGKALTPKQLARRFMIHGAGYGRQLQRLPRGARICRVPVWALRLFLRLHADALRARLAGRTNDARWHWLRRYVYVGAIRQCFGDWLRRRPVRVSHKRISDIRTRQPLHDPGLTNGGRPEPVSHA